MTGAHLQLPGLPLQRPCGRAAVLAVLVLAVFTVTAPASAQETAPRADPSIDVPGGIAAFARVLGLESDASRPRLLLTAIRRLWDVPDGQDPAIDRRRADARGYLETLAVLERARAVRRGSLPPSRRSRRSSNGMAWIGWPRRSAPRRSSRPDAGGWNPSSPRSPHAGGPG